MPPAFEGDIAAAIKTTRELGLEGVLAKRRDSTYAAGRRSRAWIKVKHVRTQEVVIGGWKPGNGARAHRVGSLLLGIPEDGALRFVGKVGTGLQRAPAGRGHPAAGGDRAQVQPVPRGAGPRAPGMPGT